MSPEKPNFLIVGAAKCGTTALDSILDLHPDCCMGRPKEVCFFQDTMDFRPNDNYEKGWQWYRNAFAHYNGESVVGEATPSYADRSRSPKTAERIFKFNPKMKIIYMVRNPLDRQISSWKMQFYEGLTGAWPDRRETHWAQEGFCSWMARQREVSQWDENRYAFQLQAYRDFFPENNILVSFLEDWVTDKEREVIRILNFLGLAPEKWDPSLKENKNMGSERTIERPVMRRLREAGIIKKVSILVPEKASSFLKRKFFKKEIILPRVDLGSAIVKEFEDYVWDDLSTAEPFRTKGNVIWKRSS